VGGWVKEKQQEQGCSLKTGERCRGTEERKARAMPTLTQRQKSNPLLVPRDVIESQSLRNHLGIHKKEEITKMCINRLGN
jgi:hypothetical protein